MPDEKDSLDSSSDTARQLRQAREGDLAARETLLGKHRSRLRRMVEMRMDPRLAARVDPSDVVQEALQVAHVRLSEYLAKPAGPFYTWLRGIALDRLVDSYRRHVVAKKRTVLREQRWHPRVSEQSEQILANSLVASDFSPSSHLIQAELLARVRQGLAQLSERDREILVLRHLEQLNVDEIADVLEIQKSTVTTRHLRAVVRLRELLGDEFDE